MAPPREEFGIDPQELPDSNIDTIGPPRDATYTSRGSTSSDSLRSEVLHIDEPRHRAHLSFFNCLALVVSLQIGSGIFFAPSQISAHVPSSGHAVLIWLLGGALVYTGAMVFAELGVRLPKNGGLQEYLRLAYGDFVGCVFSWTWLAIAKPSSMAIISMVFSEYFCRTALPQSWSSSILEKAVAVLGLGVVTLINCVGVRSGALVANVFLCLKLFTLFSIAVSGIVFYLVSIPPKSRGKPPVPDSETVSAWKAFGNYITALYGVLYCYGGWESIGFVAGEIQNPAQELPSVLNTAMSFTTIGFVLFNIGLYSIVSFHDVQTTETPVVTFATKLFGTTGGVLYSFMVSASAIGALNANTYATGRVYVSAAEQGYLPAIFSDTIPQRMQQTAQNDYIMRNVYVPPFIRQAILSITGFLSVPGGQKALRRAMVANMFVVTTYIICGTFDSLVTFVGISEYAFIFLAVAGTFSIRRKLTQNVPYTANIFYILIFCIVSFVVVLRGIITSPMQGLGIAILVGSGWVLYRFVAI